MKRPCLLILIASALLLSAETPPPQPQQSASTQSPPQQHSSSSGPSISATFQPTSSPSPSHSGAQTYNYYYYPEDSWNWSGIVEALSTLGLLGFALWQMSFVRRSTAATENAAKAASDNAVASKDSANATKGYMEIAERTLYDVQRPWVLVFTVKWPSGVFPLPIGDDTTPSAAVIAYSFKNFGTTPAWITDASGLFNKTTDLNNLPPEPVYFPTGFTHEAIVAPDSPTSEVTLPLFPNPMLTPDEIRSVERRELFLYAYGIIKYRDIHGREHETRWGWVYFVPIGLDFTRNMRLAGPKAYNRHI
jgi:hypothetical protein